MKIKVKQSRLLSSLATDRFSFANARSDEGDFSFVRTSSHPELFEWISVLSAGKRNEALYGEVHTALTRNILVKELYESQLLLEIAENQERGWCIVKTDAAAIEWESKLVAIAPLRVRQLTHERGGNLLERTESLRRAVKEYVGHLDLTKPLSTLTEELHEDVDPKLLGVAQRIGWGVRLTDQWIDAEQIYGLAWLCIARYEKAVETEGTTFSRQNPYDNRELMWRIQLIADWIIHRLGLG